MGHCWLCNQDSSSNMLRSALCLLFIAAMELALHQSQSELDQADILRVEMSMMSARLSVILTMIATTSPMMLVCSSWNSQSPIVLPNQQHCPLDPLTSVQELASLCLDGALPHPVDHCPPL